MNPRTIITIAVSLVVIFSAFLGFFITLDVSPQIAYARLFIDVGLVIGLIAVIMVFYKEPELPIENIVHALNSLKKLNYQTRLSLDGLKALSPIAAALNELASSLEEQHIKDEKMKKDLREELLPKPKAKEPTILDHSIHPELGTVVPISLESLNENPSLYEESLNKISILPTNSPINEKEQTIIQKAETKTPIEQNIDELYEKFSSIRKNKNLEIIEYYTFQKVIEKSKSELLDVHQCQAVFFDLVEQEKEVALLPRLIR